MILDVRHSKLVSNSSTLLFNLTLFSFIKGENGEFNGPDNFLLSNHFPQLDTGFQIMVYLDSSMGSVDDLIGLYMPNSSDASLNGFF